MQSITCIFTRSCHLSNNNVLRSVCHSIHTVVSSHCQAPDASAVPATYVTASLVFGTIHVAFNINTVHYAPTSHAMSVKADFDSLSRGALLEVLLPVDGKFDAVAILQAGNPEEIRKASSRKHLFFGPSSTLYSVLPRDLRCADEKTRFQLVLRTSVSEDLARKLLPSLELTISAHATNAVPEGPGNSAAASGKHDIASTKAPATSNVDLVRVKDHTYVIWKPTLHLVRPRVRLQRPAVYFTANLGIKSSTATAAPVSGKQYLPSFEPLPTNVLESLHHDPSLGSSAHQIHVSETRVTKVSPSASQLEDTPRPSTLR